MKKLYWMIVLILIGAGLFCLTMASSGLLTGNFIFSFHHFISIFIWIAVPLIVFSLIYIFYVVNLKKK